MSSLAAAALRRAVTASGARSLSISGAFSPASSRLFSADAAAAEAGSQGDDSFLKPSDAGLIYGRLYSPTAGGNRLGKNVLKTDIIHHLDKCELSPEDVKIDYNRGYYPMAALLKFPSKESFNKAARQTGRMYRLERASRELWEQKPSLDGKAVLLQGVPRNAQADDIERFLSGTNYEPPPFESFIRPGIPEPIRVVLVRFRTKADATNAFIAKNRSFCLNNPVSMRVIQ
ncbi:uncharacterized protein LOC124698187 [Lolium rigidum]|uniref:uncharacterized protein LOC124698187 n=1 Tax=Lolium rigidum TaxID=89674 RepID=UPI001F5CF830|nr:uncharacterized protein LOC124698187 [Lolium rigidum]